MIYQISQFAIITFNDLYCTQKYEFDYDVWFDKATSIICYSTAFN